MEQIPWYKSQTIRALIVAAVTQILIWANVSEALPAESSTALVDKLLDIIEGVAIAWAAYARIAKPTPPITAAAAAKMSGGN